MQVHLQKTEQGLVIPVPSDLASLSPFTEDSVVEIRLERGQFIVTSLDEPYYTIEELLEGITEENRHPEISTGGPWAMRSGEETWPIFRRKAMLSLSTLTRNLDTSRQGGDLLLFFPHWHTTKIRVLRSCVQSPKMGKATNLKCLSRPEAMFTGLFWLIK